MESEIPSSNTPGTSGAPAQPTPPKDVPSQSAGAATPPPIIRAPKPAALRGSRGTGWKIATLILACLLAFSLFSNFWHFASRAFRGSVSSTRHIGPRLEEGVLEDHNSANKIVVIPVEGIIAGDMLSAGEFGLVDMVKEQLKLAEKDDDVKAVILKVDSPGGEVVASDEIYKLIAEFQNKGGKPVVVSMGSMAASGGYYISSPCRWIVANELTITGSIGVIFHSYNIRGLLDKVGVRPEVYKSGPFKDMMSWDKEQSEITPQERQMMQKMIDDTFGRFKSVVADGRRWANKKNKDSSDDQGRTLSSEWAKFADGRVLSGKEAYDLGFVDELGNFEVAVRRTKKLAGIEKEGANLVQYHQVFDLSDVFRIFGKSEPAKIKVDVGLEVPKLKAGKLYFLAPTYVH